MQNNQCTGNCRLVGFILEYCEECGWDDGYTGSSDPYSNTLKISEVAGKEPDQGPAIELE